MLIDQPTQWTVATGRLIYPPYIWVDTPTCDVKEGKPLGTANPSWCYNVSPLNTTPVRQNRKLSTAPDEERCTAAAAAEEEEEEAAEEAGNKS